jgi:hypothetical protein
MAAPAALKLPAKIDISTLIKLAQAVSPKKMVIGHPTLGRISDPISLRDFLASFSESERFDQINDSTLSFLSLDQFQRLQSAFNSSKQLRSQRLLLHKVRSDQMFMVDNPIIDIHRGVLKISLESLNLAAPRARASLDAKKEDLLEAVFSSPFLIPFQELLLHCIQ